jgi:hypothetical protein
MRTQSEIFESIQSLIPADLWPKYIHMTYAEMADVPELAKWRDYLLAAEDEWFDEV